MTHKRRASFGSGERISASRLAAGMAADRRSGSANLRAVVCKLPAVGRAARACGSVEIIQEKRTPDAAQVREAVCRAF
jgi:hypothetical protein